MKSRIGLILLTTIVAASVTGGFFGGKANAGPPQAEDRTQELLKTYTEALATIEANFVREVSSEDLVESSIRGMLRTLDPHSSFFSRKDYNRLQEEQQGKYFGLGITIRPESPGSGRVVIVEPPAPGTPAYKAGLRAGDVIARIRGVAIDDWDINEEIIPNLKGPKGTTVDITVERPGETEPLDFTVERDEIPLHTIKYAFMIRPEIAYIRIDRFSETTSRELDGALDRLAKEGLQSLVLDLRDNPGGALSQAIAVADRFLNRNQVIVSTRSRFGKEHEHTTRREQQYAYPMVVLINRNSASASEIVSGALQDHDRALIVGETSFGKALVQTIYPLDGNRGLALTTGKYYTPSDRLIQREYAGSFWDYYNSRIHRSSEERERFLTDGGREVFGGGGIMPDVEVEQDTFSRFSRQIQRKNLFRSFASRLYSGSIESDADFYAMANGDREKTQKQKQALVDQVQITDQLLDRFTEYMAENDLEFSEEEFESDREIIRNLLRRELLLLLVGDEASYKVALELDRQVQTAIGSLDQATVLMKRHQIAKQIN